MSRRKEDDMSFDIKRAYEKWLEEGQPIQGDEATEKKETGRQPSEKANRKQSTSADSRERDRKSGRRDRGADNRQEKFRGDSRRKSPASRTGMRAVRGLPEIPKVDPESSFPKCPVRKRCGGCSFIGLDYKWTLEYKEKYVSELLKPFVKLSGIVGMDDPYHYRNKVNAAFAHVKDGRRERNVSGIYEQGTHKVVPVKECLLEDKRADAIIQDILKMTRDFKIKIYDEDSEYGLLRHVMVRTGHVTGQVMVVLVLASAVLPNKNAFVEKLLEKHPEITTIVISVNDEHTSMVLGDREIVIYGKGYIEDKLCGNTFRISPKSFYQVNSVQTEKLYRQAVNIAVSARSASQPLRKRRKSSELS